MKTRSVGRFARWALALLALGSAPDVLSDDRLPTLPEAPAPTPELVLLNWADYLPEDLVEAFERTRGVEVRLVYYEGDEAREAMLAKSAGLGYDLVLISGPRLDAYRRRGWLTPITPAEVPNLAQIDPRWLKAYGAEGVAVPYAWGTTGIGYRADLVDEPIRSWRQFFEPAAPLRGKLSLIKSNRDLIGLALKALGHSLNSEDPAHLAAAEALLRAQKPHVFSYSYVDLDEHSHLVTGEVVAAMMFSGDALLVKEHHPEIVYVLPEEGGALWVDYWVVMPSSPNKALAMDFLNFLNEPENAARVAQALYYASPNRAAERLLPAGLLADPVVYPDPEQLERSEFPVPLSPRATRLYNRVYHAVVD